MSLLLWCRSRMPVVSATNPLFLRKGAVVLLVVPSLHAQTTSVKEQEEKGRFDRTAISKRIEVFIHYY